MSCMSSKSMPDCLNRLLIPLFAKWENAVGVVAYSAKQMSCRLTTAGRQRVVFIKREMLTKTAPILSMRVGYHRFTILGLQFLFHIAMMLEVEELYLCRANLPMKGKLQPKKVIDVSRLVGN